MEKEWLPAQEVAAREFNSLRGRLCTAIESAGLPKKQERNLVQMIKNLSYQNQEVIRQLVIALDPSGEREFAYNAVKLLEDNHANRN